MPTLYDNFERVRQYIDQHQGGGDMSAYVTKDELSAQSYITNEVTQLDGPLFISYQTANNAQYTLNAYSHIIAGIEDKTGLSLVATKRKCGGDEGTSYMASFFTNSDGRSKFAHKTKINATEVGGQADDAFMCFNAYGFRIAYSGTEGVSASTEYEILHEGNIGNLGYITMCDVSACGYISSIPSTYASYNGVYSYLKSIGITNTGFGGSNIDSAVITDSELSGDIAINGINTWELPTYAAISNMGYVTSNDISGKADKSDLRSYLSVSNWSTGDYDIQLRKTGLTLISTNHSIAPATIAYEYVDNSSYTNAWIGLNTLKNYVNGRLSEIEASYATTADLPVINENIIPKETGTYTLGNADHLYDTTYTSKIQSVSTGLGIRLGNAGRYAFYDGAFRAADNNRNLGTSDYKWAATYTSNLYADTIHNFIWTGTSAEYAALSDYTTYQIYMIKEA